MEAPLMVKVNVGLHLIVLSFDLVVVLWALSQDLIDFEAIGFNTITMDDMIKKRTLEDEYHTKEKFVTRWGLNKAQSR